VTTPATTRSRLLPTFACFGLLAACGTPEPAHSDAAVAAVEAKPSASDNAADEAQKPVAVEPAPAATDQTPPPSSALPASGQPGAVYLAINTMGLVKLDHTGATVLLAKPERNISDLFIGPDGAVYLLDAHSLRRIEADKLIEVERFELGKGGPVNALALARDGNVWISNGEGIGARVDGEWQMTSFEALGVERSAAIAIAADDTVWVIGSRALLYREAEQWVPVDPMLLLNLPMFLNATGSPIGPVNTTTGHKLTRLGKTALDSVLIDPKEVISYTAALDIAADGHAGLASSACDLVRVNPQPPTLIWRFAASDYDCQTAEAMAMDLRHRFWVASREGLSVVAEDRSVHEYPAGSFTAIAGRVSHMVVTGQGPELPPVGAVRTATITATLKVGAKPAANAAIELCPSVRLHGEGSPCSDAKRRYTGTTDAKGRVRVQGVAIGDYSVALELDGIWRWSIPPSFAAQLREGESHDLGVISLASRP
jgi:ligand-binding sensor domain-containing protein